ncbi:hypothetical protein PCAR4_140200 [Paraburkholderia caribensis]|nr:hypothetical protein PCAR4_140200 [Paraburkholderia caribensis]
MKAIAATLPKDFPERVAERIFDGLRGISGTASGDATGRLSAA